MGRPSPLWLALGLIAGPAWADFDPSAYPPYERCALCHGLFGVSHMAKFPNLAGQKPAYIEAQLDAFLSGQRTNDGGQMAAIVTELLPEEIPVVIEWFSTQDPPLPSDPPDDGVGQTLVEEAGCLGCHDESPESAPYLTAQHAGYLEKQMEDFISGARTEAEIATVHKGLLSAPEINLTAIATYLASLERAP